MKTNNHIRGLMSAAVAMLLMALPCLGLSAQENNMSRNSVYLSTGGQPYGFGGKERQRLGRAASYDFLARQYDPVLCRFTTRDPLAEKYYSVSPYAYCAGDPVNRVDPDGLAWYFNSSTGEFLEHVTDDGDDHVYLLNAEQIDDIYNNHDIISKGFAFWRL